MSAQERYQILVEINANVTKAVDALDKVSGKMGETEKKTAGLHGVLSNAAGFLVRDFARSMGGAITDAVELGGNIDTLRKSFEALSVASGQQVPTLDDLRTATQGMVSDTELLKAANQALQLGLPTENLDEMMMSAIQLGSAMGIDAANAVASLSTGIGRQSKLILDNLGIVFDATDAYKWYADKIGKSTNELDENAKKTAWMEYAIEQVNKKATSLGDNISEQTKNQAQWNASMANFKTRVGEALAPVSGLITAMQPLLPLLSTMAIKYLPDLIAKVPKFASSIGGLDLNIKSVGISLAAALGAFGSVYAVLTSLPPELQGTASAIAVVGGALIAAAAAAAVFWGTITVGTAVPIILAGVGAAVAGVMVALQDAGDIAKEFTDDLDAIADGALGVGDAMGEMADETRKAAEGSSAYIRQMHEEMRSAEEEAYTTQVSEVIAFWADRIAIEENEWTKLIDSYHSYYNKLEDEARDSGNEQVSIIKDTFSKQLDSVRDFYDAQIRTINEGLASIRGERSDELDRLELNYLLEKDALEQSLSDKQVSEEDFASQMQTLEDSYRSTRAEISDSYRIQELQYELGHKDDLLRLETEKAEAIKNIEAEKNAAILEAEQTLSIQLQGIYSQRTGDLAAIYEEQEILAQAHASRMAEITAEEAEAWSAYQYLHSKEGAMEALMASAHEAFQTEDYTKYLNILKLLEMRGWATPEELTAAQAAVPGAQHGGVFGLGGPQVIRVGEREPEAVIPISKMPIVESKNNYASSLQYVTLQFNAPIVRVEGSADRKTAIVAAELVKEALKTVKIQVTSPQATTSKVAFTESGLPVAGGLPAVGGSIAHLLPLFQSSSQRPRLV